MKTLFILLFSLAIISCKQESLQPENQNLSSDSLYIRISNKSTYQFEEVYVRAFGKENNYGKIKPGSTSQYMPFDSAYSYAYVKTLIKGKEFVLQPIDYVGEEKLTPGKYTYVISVVDYKNKRLALEFKEEK